MVPALDLGLQRVETADTRGEDRAEPCRLDTDAGRAAGLVERLAGRVVHRREQGLIQRGPRSEKSYRAALDRLFDSGKIADLVNTKSISSAIDFFFGRSELSPRPVSQECL